jgi:AcrR family transcriptional regulator
MASWQKTKGHNQTLAATQHRGGVVLNRSPSSTAERILKCAQDVLVADGYSKFTIRRVAEAAEISPGNLAYHFSTKQSLIQEMVRRLCGEILNKFQILLSDSSQQSSPGLDKMVRRVLTDSATEYTVRTFRELWVISLHDEVVCQAVDDMYDTLMSGTVDLLQQLHPNASERSIRESVQLLALISEGTAVLYGTRRDRLVSQERIIELVTQLLASVISSSDKRRVAK